MGERMLAGAELEALRGADLTYAEVGHTEGELPLGYHHLSRTLVIGAGSARFEEAVETLFGWGMHRRAGVPVRASAETVVQGAVAVLTLGVGRIAVTAPVRVVRVWTDPHRSGFAYGTLPGHPESGEEAFLLEHHDDGEVTFTVTAFSRPATVLTRVAGPVGRAVQRWATNRYLRSV